MCIVWYTWNSNIVFGGQKILTRIWKCSKWYETSRNTKKQTEFFLDEKQNWVEKNQNFLFQKQELLQIVRAAQKSYFQAGWNQGRQINMVQGATKKPEWKILFHKNLLVKRDTLFRVPAGNPNNCLFQLPKEQQEDAFSERMKFWEFVFFADTQVWVQGFCSLIGQAHLVVVFSRVLLLARSDSTCHSVMSSSCPVACLYVFGRPPPPHLKF